MSEPTAASIAAATERITALARRTPVEPSTLLGDQGVHVWLKMEIWQRTGSFKIRGALNRMAQLSPVERTTGIVTASAGNHAQGVAASAVHLQIPAIIVVAADASPAKVAALQGYDPAWVTVRRMGRDYDEAEAGGIALAKELGRHSSRLTTIPT